MKRKLALSAAALVAALLAAEGVVRIALGAELRSIYTLDEDVLHRLVPGSSHVFTRHPNNGGTKILVEVNDDGYRGPSLRTDGAYRVAVFGDSFVHAEYSRLEDTFGARVGELLARGLEREVEVVNAGVSGYGPDQSILRMESELDRLRPDLVVFVICAANDLGDLFRNKLFRLDGDGRLERCDPIFGAVLVREFAAGHEASYLLRFARKFKRNRRLERAWQIHADADESVRLATARQLVDGSLLECRRAYEEFVVRGDLTVRNLLADNYDADVALEPESDSAKYKLDLFRALLARCAARLAGWNAVVVVVPSSVDACEAHGNGIVDPARWPDYRRSTLTDEIASAVRACGLDCVDLFVPFRERGQDVYFAAPDGHWNDAGQDLAARVVAEHVLDGR